METQFMRRKLPRGDAIRKFLRRAFVTACTLFVVFVLIWYAWPKPRRMVAPSDTVDSKRRPVSEPLLQAIRADNVQEVKKLLDHGVDPNSRSAGDIETRKSALECAAEHNDTEIARLLLDRGAQVNVEGAWGDSALSSAVFQKNPELVQVFIDHGANLDSGGEGGPTMLGCAVLDLGATILKRENPSRNLQIIAELRAAGGRCLTNFGF